MEVPRLVFRDSPEESLRVFRAQSHTPTGLTPLHGFHILPVRR